MLGGRSLVQTSRLSRFAFYGLMVSFCTQWVSIGAVAGLNVRTSHVFTVLLAAGLVASPGRHLSNGVGLFARNAPGLIGGLFLLVVPVCLANIVWGTTAIGMVEIMRLAVNVATAVVVAAYIYGAKLEGRGLQKLAIVCVVVTTYFLLTPFIRAGGDVVGALRRAMFQGDENAVIFGVFRRAFIDAGTGIDRANFRHGLAASMLLVMYLTLIAKPHDRISAWLLQVGVGGCVLWVLLSFSRATWAAFALALIPLAARPLLARTRFNEVIGLICAIGLIVAAGVFGVFGSFTNRVARGGTYQGRINKFRTAYEAIADRAIIGGPPPEAEANAHNIVTEAWIAGGFVAAIGGAVMVAAAARLCIAGASSAISDGLNGHGFVVCGLAAIPLVRLLTSGNPLMQGSNWAAWGAALALFAVSQQPTALKSGSVLG